MQFKKINFTAVMHTILYLKYHTHACESMLQFYNQHCDVIVLPCMRAHLFLFHYLFLTVTLRAAYRSTIKCYFIAALRADKDRLFCLFQIHVIICSTKCYKTYEILKSTISKFSNACKRNERKRGFGAEKKGEVSVELWTQ